MRHPILPAIEISATYSREQEARSRKQRGIAAVQLVLNLRTLRTTEIAVRTRSPEVSGFWMSEWLNFMTHIGSSPHRIAVHQVSSRKAAPCLKFAKVKRKSKSQKEGQITYPSQKLRSVIHRSSGNLRELTIRELIPVRSAALHSRGNDHLIDRVDDAIRRCNIRLNHVSIVDLDAAFADSNHDRLSFYGRHFAGR